MLQKNDVPFENLSGIIFVAGPGSYTGIRLSEGMLQIFEWQKFSVYSFYHFDVPRMLGEVSGCWFSTAFKGEIFIHRWNDKNSTSKLVKSKDFMPLIETEELQGPFFTHFIKEDCFKIEVMQTTDMIKHNSHDLFSKIIGDQLRCSPYYFRRLEEEFRVPSNNIKKV